MAKADSTLEGNPREQVGKQFSRFLLPKKQETLDANFNILGNAVPVPWIAHRYACMNLRTFKEAMKGSFFGIGAQLKKTMEKLK
ncbi:MAG: hypothetical protein IPH56_13475 [Chitinophagaceae bacterium]|nr:hypothetical protein [Chitinophagaceae bacterium]